MASILVIGHSGQLGSAFRAIASVEDAHEWHVAPRAEIDLSEPGAAETAIVRYRPDVVINTAAYTAVDKAESEPELAEAVNATAPGEMARACASTGALLMHFSTDYVFDGTGRQPYRESDAVAPLGVYGRTKLAGEKAIAAAHDRHLIVRTSWVFDAFGSNFVNTMLRLGAERDTLGVVSDQRGSPTYAPDLAAATLALAERALGDDGEKRLGVYHASGGGQTTWHGFASRIFELANVDVALNAITTEDYPTPAPRPAYSVLDNSRLAALGIELPDWDNALERCLRLRGDLDS